MLDKITSSEMRVFPILPLTWYKSVVARPSLPRPTDGELAILRVLWASGGLTCRKVHRELTRVQVVSYSSVLTRLQILVDKGLVRIDDTDRPKVFHALVDEAATRGGFVRDLVDRLFGGSTRKLVQHLVSEEKMTDQEITEIRRALRKSER